MKSPRILTAIMLVASTSLVACANESIESQPPAEDAAEEVGEVADPLQATEERKGDDKRHKRGKHAKKGKRGKGAKGPLGMFMKSLHELELSAEQKAELKEMRGAMRDNKRGPDGDGFSKALAAAVESGNVSVQALAPELDAMEERATERAAKMQEAFNSLHSIHTAEQREELVSNIEERMDARADRPNRVGKGKRNRGGKDGHMLRKLTHKLDLTDAQKAEVENLQPAERPDRKAKHEEMQAKMRTVLDAFAGDSFDATALGVGNEMAAMARTMAEHKIEGLAKLVPILEVEQREQLAKTLTERGHHKRGDKKRGKRGRFGKDRPQLDARPRGEAL